MISFLLPVRLNNSTEKLFRWLNSVYKSNSDNQNNYEILIKFDDDEDITKALEIINVFKLNYKVNIRYINTPRYQGFKDLSKSLLDLLVLINEKSTLVMSGSVDMILKKKNFANEMLKMAKNHTYSDNIFIINTKYSILETIKSKKCSVVNAANEADPFVIWSRKWLEIQHGFGYNPFNDSFTTIVAFFLLKNWGIIRIIDATHLTSIEETNCTKVGDDEWNGKRRNFMELHLSSQCINFAKQTAKNIALNILYQENISDNYFLLRKSLLDMYDQNAILQKEVIIKDKIRKKVYLLFAITISMISVKLLFFI